MPELCSGLVILLPPSWHGCHLWGGNDPACSPSIFTHGLSAVRTTSPIHPAQATHLDAKLALPRLGLAQLNVLQNEAVNAASLLESVLVDAPQWIDALEVRCG